MKFEEFRQLDGLGLAKLVEQKEVSAQELLEVAIARAEAVNPTLNAIVNPMYEIARKRARESLQGPFAGVPMLIKDLAQDYKGVTTTMGNKALKRSGQPAVEHSTIVQRWLDAGAVIFGLCNSSEFGTKAVTEPAAWGASRNPWNIQRGTGGSSGGSAAAVAAGIVPIAGGNDGGGSIRIPASNCGLFGFKPGRGRTPGGPHYTDIMHGAGVQHVLTRSVRDSAAMLDATHGPEPGSLFHIVPPEKSYLTALEADPPTLKIGFSTRSPVDTPVDLHAVKAVEQAARLLESLGHVVEPAEPECDGMQMTLDFTKMWYSHCSATVAAIKRTTGSGNLGFEADSMIMATYGDQLSGREYVEACSRWTHHARQLNRFHQRYDLWLSPTQATPPMLIGESQTPAWKKLMGRALVAARLERLIFASGQMEQVLLENARWTPYTLIANITGVPAMSVPLYWCDDDLPLGVQFIAAQGGESTLFALAAQLERAQPWFGRTAKL